MSNPQISFRLTPYQLARGLKILRTQEPAFVPTSLAQMVKELYLDYIAKTSLQHTDVISDQDLTEIQNLICNKRVTMSLTAFQQATNQKQPMIKKPVSQNNADNKPEEKSKITSVSDFSPPEDWNQEA